ncbi:related to cytochrome P450 CYP3/CYP5/CYP6/CYP9 subfamilies [Rhynchosporium agropyri]|uniref:Related to cytochrome P450 CYP3/CYP5/CYP6/CYP9 subfamilies n=1 Tax=Rhynchosporium agropyri TaxID=914238 RepID=A0A1E1LL38_9HELO|nr:related to cytochrome P450 CYP3/CYP5/CYP6/CYP9 subfamilies [Rhynchosporium agropyri]
MLQFVDLQASWVLSLTAGLVLYSIAGMVYRVWFSPLSRFPGPKLAAATLFYEAYYDVIKTGKYTFKIRELHKKYGPIIRISPYELHVDDPEFYETLFSWTAPRNKYEYYTVQFGTPKANFSTVDHHLHRLRRQPQNKFFSRASILRLEPIINGMIEKLCSRIDRFKTSGEPMPLDLAYRCLTTDVVTKYALNKSWDYLDSENFSPKWFETIKATAGMGHLIKQANWILPVVRALPDSVMSRLSPDMMLILDWQKDLERHVQTVIDNIANGTDKHDPVLPRTVFHTLLDSDLPADEISKDRMAQEAQVIIGAGADTTAHALSTITFFLLSSPEKLEKLQKELKEAFPDRDTSMKLTDVEKLPYLSAVIQEGIRLSYGLSTRLARIAPDEVLQYKDYSIPAGTPVGMTSVMMHHNETIFPDSYTFTPERWLDPAAAKRLERYIVTFTRGSRQCIGMHLAKAEIFLTTATVFRRYDLELYDTVRERDIDLAYDGFIPQASPEGKGVRVVIK